MQDLIPPPQPNSPPSPQPARPSDSAQEFWGAAPEIEFRPVYPGRGRWRLYAATTGALLLTLGVGLAAADKIGGYVFKPPPPDPIAVKATEALNATLAQRQEIAALRIHVDSLKNKLESQAQKTRGEEATIGALQKSLAEEKADSAASASQLQARIEKIQSQAAAEKAAEKAADKTPTASIPKPLPRPAQVQAAQVQAAQAQAANAAPVLPPRAAGPYRAFVLRDVGRGRALIEGAGRMEEVEPGDILPGGAMVQRIERRGQSWVVMTDRGYIGPELMWDE